MYSTLQCKPFPSPIGFLNLESCIGGWIVWVILISGVSWIYSLFMNKVFGHSTYWQRSAKISSNFISEGNKSLTNSATMRFRRKPSNERLLDSIDEYVLKSAVAFLSIKDVLVLSTVNKSYCKLCQCPSIWKKFESRLFEKIVPKDIMSWMPSRIAGSREIFFFKLLVYHKVFALEKQIVLIHLNVYDVTSFIGEHPGGDAVMREKLGRDASEMFDYAHHSPFATQLMGNMCIWSPARVLGSKGLPAIAVDLKREIAQYLQ
jgi:hypothetical protein